MNPSDVQRMSNVAFVLAHAAAARCEVEGMVAANRERLARGDALAYDEDAFFGLIDKYDLGHHAVITALG